MAGTARGGSMGVMTGGGGESRGAGVGAGHDGPEGRVGGRGAQGVGWRGWGGPLTAESHCRKSCASVLSLISVSSV